MATGFKRHDETKISETSLNVVQTSCSQALKDLHPAGNERFLLRQMYLNAVTNAAFSVVVIDSSTLLLWEFKSVSH